MAEIMARHFQTTIRYDGPALAGHEMDVQDLAPALLALAEIVQIANRKFNGDTADVRILVDADTAQKCFQLDLSLVQSILDQAATIFGQRDIATVKEIAEWIGLGVGSFTGLFQLYKFIAAKGDGGIALTASGEAGTVIVQVLGDNNTIVVPTQTAELVQDAEVRKRVITVLKPLQKEGYDELQFLQNDTAVTSFNKADAESVIAAPLPALEAVEGRESVSQIRGEVRIKSAQYEGAARWSLLWNGRAVDAEMSEKAAEWVTDFQENRISAPPHSTLDVSMTETIRLDERGMAIGKPSYVVTDVHSVRPPSIQGKLFDEPA